MKNLVLLIAVLTLAGCSTYHKEGKPVSEYFNEPEKFFKDPQFDNYQTRRDILEGQYLRKEISYVEYTQQLQELEDVYNRQVKQREDKLGQKY